MPTMYMINKRSAVFTGEWFSFDVDSNCLFAEDTESICWHFERGRAVSSDNAAIEDRSRGQNYSAVGGARAKTDAGYNCCSPSMLLLLTF